MKADSDPKNNRPPNEDSVNVHYRRIAQNNIGHGIAGFDIHVDDGEISDNRADKNQQNSRN